MRPRDGRPHVLDDVSSAVLLQIVASTSANPHVVRPLVLMLTEMANTHPQVLLLLFEFDGLVGVTEKRYVLWCRMCLAQGAPQFVKGLETGLNWEGGTKIKIKGYIANSTPVCHGDVHINKPQRVEIYRF